ncbi:SDR family oxidoreductase [Hymenobacter psoromatis]|uniref:SDR family oxidoreductase n=1 Tax=Hymenobacter psoromatis TaxID=1484116 RepID=UPI001CBF8024|nr:SDR family oxidoreductase [Hymenobacter psoromatis]
MRVFVTGATGFIGSAVVQELLGAGHQVLGLSRSDKGNQALTAAGAEVHRGSLDDLDSLRSGAAAADGVIHLAFIHDFSQYAAAGETDRRAIEAMGEALAGTNKPLVVTSGLAGLASGRLATEADTPASMGRVSEPTALAQVARGVRATVVRLAPSVHDDGDYGFVPALINIAREKGAAAYIGDGQNRWPAVHRLDAARLFRLALERGVAGGRYHGAADEGIPMRDLAAVIGRHLNVPVLTKSPEEAAEHFGWMALFAGLDMPATSARTQQELGWQPTHKGLLADLEEGSYFGK